MSMFSQSNNGRLVQDMKSVVADAEAVLRESAGQAGGKVTELHAAMTARMAAAKDRMFDLEQALLQQARQAARNTNEYVHENPWRSLAVVGGLVFLIGYLNAPRRAGR